MVTVCQAVIAWFAFALIVFSFGVAEKGLCGTADERAPARVRLPLSDDSGRASPVRAAKFVEDMDLSYCLKVVEKEAREDDAPCPGFIIEALKEALEDCTSVEGRLVPYKKSWIGLIDINGDQKPEYLFNIKSNFSCDAALDLFDCGKQPCGFDLYENVKGRWHRIGEIHPAGDDDTIEVLPAEGEPAHPDIRVTGKGPAPYGDSLFYRWTGTSYELALRKVHGYWVVPTSLSGRFWHLKPDTDELLTPVAGSEVVGKYGTDAIVVVIGEVLDAPYYYVSPCDACEAGFIKKSDLADEVPPK